MPSSALRLPEPVSGRRMSSGAASFGRRSRSVSGASAFVRIASRPERAVISSISIMAARAGINSSAVWKPSFAPETKARYVSTRRHDPRRIIRHGTAAISHVDARSTSVPPFG